MIRSSIVLGAISLFLTGCGRSDDGAAAYGPPTAAEAFAAHKREEDTQRNINARASEKLIEASPTKLSEADKKAIRANAASQDAYYQTDQLKRSEGYGAPRIVAVKPRECGWGAAKRDRFIGAIRLGGALPRGGLYCETLFVSSNGKSAIRRAFFFKAGEEWQMFDVEPTFRKPLPEFTTPVP